MTMNYLEAKVRYKTMDEEGRRKTANETYLIDALSYTEAEAKLLKELENAIHDDYFITGIKKSNIEEVLVPGGVISAKWYKAKIAIVDADPQTGKEQKQNRFLLIAEEDVDKALERLQKEISNYVIPVEIISIGDSNIIDVINHN